MAILTLDGVHKSYGQVKALDDICFDHEGGFHALLGQNGAGKSTLFQLLTGLFVADQGEIHIAGRNLRTEMVKVLADIGVVFQQPSLDLDMSVRANLQFYGRLRGMSSALIRRRMEEELARLGLLDDIGRPCRALSGGNRRKVELARALMGEPKLLLMDEATIGLDPGSRDSLVKYVYSLCREKSMAALWATHLVDEAEGADRVLVLHKGRLMAHGSPQDLIRETGMPTLLESFLSLSGIDTIAT
jgi:ABC-2 type transport system ATP-binding protein